MKALGLVTRIVTGFSRRPVRSSRRAADGTIQRRFDVPENRQLLSKMTPPAHHAALPGRHHSTTLEKKMQSASLL